MPSPLTRYARWLHLRWPAGRVEPLPRVREDGSTNVPGIYVAGDLIGVPLLKFALDSGAAVVARIARDPELRQAAPAKDVVDLVIVGAGVSGIAAALEAQRRGFTFHVLEASAPFATLHDFPARKPIFTYPTGMVPAGRLRVSATVKEDLLEELERQRVAAAVEPVRARAEWIERIGDLLHVHLSAGPPIRARRVLVAIGRTGDYRPLGVPGERLDVVHRRLHDPKDFAGRRATVVGGGDAAVEAAVALAEAGAAVTLVHRGASLSRPKPANLARIAALRAPTDDAHALPGRVAVRLASRLTEIRASEVVVGSEGRPPETIPGDVVFAMIGRDPPLTFLRRSGIAIAGERGPSQWLGMVAFFALCVWLYDWKSGGVFSNIWYARNWFPVNLPELLARLGGAVAAASSDPRTLIGTLAISAASPSFFYTLAYSMLVVGFGVRRMRRRRTPYVTAQTLALMAFQVVPLFLLPEIVLPLLYHRGMLPAGIADALFPVVSYGHGREFWRAYGLILAWPLDVYNVFTHDPLPWWLAISALQTLVLIPLAVFWFGKGAYCGWICSCGALAETLGDTHRHKMPHGPGWNRLNLAGQGVLAIAVVLLGLRVAGWLLPHGNPAERLFEGVLQPSYKWAVDVFLAGVIGFGAYFWFSGRVWCRFFCPLAALMHVYARFARFAIVADKKKCISCNVCTSVCHQGIDVMTFANQGLPMRDPQCVRCSACVQACPTGVLSFGQARTDGTLIRLDTLVASPVQARERI